MTCSSTGLQGLLEQYSDVFKHSLQGLLEQYSDVFKHSLRGLLEQYSDVFKDSLGAFVGRKAKIEVDPSAQTHYCKARTLPYAMRLRVEEELERLVTKASLIPWHILSGLHR